jgi:hypothetical protein
MQFTSECYTVHQPPSKANNAHGHAPVSQHPRFHHGGEDSHIVQACPDDPARLHHIVRDIRDKRREVSPSFQQNTSLCLCPVPCTDKLNGKICQRATPAMDPNRKSARRTNIIDDLDAIALASGQRKASPKKKKKKKKTGAAGASAPKHAAGPSTPKNGAGPSGTNNTGTAKPKPAKKAAASKQPEARFYERDGMRIPLYEKNGKKRKQARLTSSLRNKNTDYLLDQVEEIGGVEKRKEFKDADTTKFDMAEWIERHETYALGPHPKSKLDPPAVKLELAIEESELSSGDILADDGNWADAKGHQQSDDVKGKTRMNDPEQQTSMSFSVQRDTVAQSTSVPTNHTGKRKHDNTHEPAQSSQQTTKKLKPCHTEKHAHEQISSGHIYTEPEAKNGHRKVRFEEAMDGPSKTEELHILSADKVDNKCEQLVRDKQLQGFMDDIGMHPENPDVSTMVVRLPEQGMVRILTASTNPAKERLVLHDTHISDRYLYRNQHHEQRARSVRPPPFLKPGTHGRYGNFGDDSDRQTGRGHEIAQKDEVDLHQYLQYRGQVLSKYPKFPRVNEQDEELATIKQVWNENELWYRHFTERYTGYAINHLWPCGCEKLRGESEDEESEAE